MTVQTWEAGADSWLMRQHVRHRRPFTLRLEDVHRSPLVVEIYHPWDAPPEDRSPRWWEKPRYYRLCCDVSWRPKTRWTWLWVTNDEFNELIDKGQVTIPRRTEHPSTYEG